MARNFDFRVPVGWRDHAKMVRLEDRHGQLAPYCWLTMIEKAAAHHPDGNLGRLSARELGLFVKAKEFGLVPEEVGRSLIELRMVDVEATTGVVTIHAWLEFNQYAADAPIRAANASKAGKASAALRASQRPVDDPLERPVDEALNGSLTKGANPRPDQTRQKRENPEERESTSSPLSAPDGTDPPPQVDQVLALWEATAKACGLPGGRRIAKLTKSRRRHLKARLGERGWLDDFREACAKLVRDRPPFLLGENDRGWKASLDFLLQDGGVAKILEGRYDGQPAAPRGPAQGADVARQVIAAGAELQAAMARQAGAGPPTARRLPGILGQAQAMGIGAPPVGGSEGGNRGDG